MKATLEAHKLVESDVSNARKRQSTFQIERMWFAYSMQYCETEWEEVCGEMSVLKKIEQRLNVKFLVKLGKSGPKINKILSTVYGEDALKLAMIYKWVKCFEERREDIGMLAMTCGVAALPPHVLKKMLIGTHTSVRQSTKND